MCGKDSPALMPCSESAGSPPHVRERQKSTSTLSPGRGITPACAGKTTIPDVQIDGIQDHPRMCGKDLSNPCLMYRL